MIGQIVGNYKIIERLGEGGMGEVYKGVDLLLERQVAIKSLRPELASQPQLVERFRSEAVILARLNHPNISTLYSFFRQGNQFFMVLEFVPGEPLDKLIARRGSIPCDEAIPLFCQVLDGIDYAHRMGIIHRDIKPANMMLTEEGRLKVLDFGIARILGSAHMTRSGHLIGTVEYMSPEQIKGNETDSRSDIYSLGILLYEMLTGRVPFTGENEYDLMKAQIETEPTPLRCLNPSIPFEVEQAILRALAKNPSERSQTAGEFSDVLLSAGYAPLPSRTSGSHAAYSPTTSRISNPQIPAASRSNSNLAQTPSISAEYPKRTRIAGVADVFSGSGARASEPIGDHVSMPDNESSAGLHPNGHFADALPSAATPNQIGVAPLVSTTSLPATRHLVCVADDYRGRIFYDPIGDISVLEETRAQTPQYYAWNGTATDIDRNAHTRIFPTVDEAIQAAILLRWY